MRRCLAIILILAVLLLGIGGCGESRIQKDNADQPVQQQNMPVGRGEPANEGPGLQVHFIDVGQGDSILVIAPGGQAMLVDGGDNEHGQIVVDYLHAQGIKKLAVLVATHPHADHIGGLSAVLSDFKVDRVYMPRVINNTDQFARLLNAVKGQGLKITTAKAGVKIALSRVGVVFLAPNSQNYENMNDYSAVIKLTYDKTSFLLAGDASELSEDEMMAGGADLRADVLKIGHHGSHSGSSEEFLQAVAPRYAVIMCGVGNDYGHPHRETLERLSRAGVEIYRTDCIGTITMKSDGEEIQVCTNEAIKESSNNRVVTEAPGVATSGVPANMYIGNRNSLKFHRPICNSLPQESNRVNFNNREEAITSGYTPCKRCRP